MNKDKCYILLDIQVFSKFELRLQNLTDNCNYPRLYVGCKVLPGFAHPCFTVKTKSGKMFQNLSSQMYVPGSDARKIGKIPTMKADCICLDCEDGVALNMKEQVS